MTTTDDPLGALEARGLVSPIFGAFIEEPPDLVADGAILFVFPQRVRALLASLQRQTDLRDRVFVTHGLASVGVMCASRDEVDRVVSQLSEFGAGYECWPLKGNAVDVAGIERMEPPQASLLPDPAERLEFAGLPYEAATQVRQFERTMARLRQVVLRYMPEAAELLESLAKFMAVSLDDLNEIAGSDSLGDVQRSRHIVTGMVEMNAGLSMMVAQAEAGTVPLLSPNSAVAEYSLLGIGSAWRGLYGLYRFLHSIFASARLVARLDDVYCNAAAFDPHTLRNNSTYDDWHDSRCSSYLSAGSGGSPRDARARSLLQLAPGLPRDVHNDERGVAGATCLRVEGVESAHAEP